jgi:hypothetical protein
MTTEMLYRAPADPMQCLEACMEGCNNTEYAPEDSQQF